MRALLPGLVLLSCATPFPKLDLTTLPKPADFPDAKYVVLLDELHVRYAPGEKGKAEAVLTERWRVKVLKATALPNVSASYDTEFSEVVSMSGRSVMPDGTERPLDVSKAVDRPVFDSSTLFSNTRVRTVAAPALPVGAVFESLVVTRLRDVEPGAPLQVLGGWEPVKEARLVVDAPSSWKVRWVARTFDGPTDLQPTETSLPDGFTRRVFERRDVASLPSDPGAPDVWSRHLRVRVRLDEWTEDGQVKRTPQSPEALSALGYVQHLDRAQLTPELEAAAKEALKGVPDEPFAKARALYEYTCRRIQYCAVEIGYGGWIPHAAKDVHAQRWGDCKDKATYLHTLLKVAGIASSPTAIASHDGWPRPFEVPSLGANFNHEILAVHLPGGTVYADPTTRAVPFGQLPWRDSDAVVLEAAKEGAPLKKTPPTSPAQNVEVHRYEVTLDDKGNAQGRFHLDARGDNASGHKGRKLMGTGRLQTWARGQLWLKNAEVVSAAFDDRADFAEGSAVSGELSARRVVARGLGSASLLRVSDILSSWMPEVRPERTTPFAWKWLATTDVELIVTFPAGVTVSTLPENVTLTSGYGEYSLTWKRTGQGLMVSRHFRRDQRVVQPGEMAEVHAFVEKVSLAELTPAVIRFGGAR